MFDWADKTVAITGASSGIGEALARRLGGKARRLLLVARSRARLEAISADIVGAEAVACDLALANDRQALATMLVDQRVDVLVNNAGVGLFGEFSKADPPRIAELLEINLQAVVELTRALLPRLLAQGSGAIVNIASNAGLQGCPYMSVYAGAKSFLINWSEGLAGELRGTGVGVHVVCPGSTRTRFFAAAGLDVTTMPVKVYQTPEDVAREILRAVDRGRVFTITGRANRALYYLERCVPRAVARAVTRRLFRRLKDATTE
ncbi:MAG: SDR family NAD(P)-dependent oxidoreductase [Planctomycetota bacterium]